MVLFYIIEDSNALLSQNNILRDDRTVLQQAINIKKSKKRE